MNKSELIEKIQKKTKLSKVQIELVLNSLIDSIVESLSENEDVKIVGFGVFTKAHRKSRRARNLKTGETLILPSKSIPRFRPGKEFKEKIEKS